MFIGLMGSSVACNGSKSSGYSLIPHLGLKCSLVFLGRLEEAAAERALMAETEGRALPLLRFVS